MVKVMTYEPFEWIEAYNRSWTSIKAVNESHERPSVPRPGGEAGLLLAAPLDQFGARQGEVPPHPASLRTLAPNLDILGSAETRDHVEPYG